MPRASRYLQAGYTYHLTHRCHDRRFLLKFVRDRDAYRRWLREAVNRYSVAVYQDGIETALARRELQRVPEWTEALAVGDRLFVERITQSFARRSKFDYAEVNGDSQAWSVHEARNAYTPLPAPESDAKPF